MSRQRDHENGFTLIEMMAVLFIIALMTTVVLLRAPGKPPELESQAREILQQIRIVSQDSIISGKTQAFGLYEDAYVFFEFDEGEWIIRSETDWPDDVTIEFYREELKVEIPDEPVPMVVFEPLGLSTPFSLELESDDTRLRFISEGDGHVYMETAL